MLHSHFSLKVMISMSGPPDHSFSRCSFVSLLRKRRSSAWDLRGRRHQRASQRVVWFQKWGNKSTPRCHHVKPAHQHYCLLLSLFSTSYLDDDRDAAVELSFVESKAQAQRLSERGGEGVEVGQVAGWPHLGEGDGACVVVHSDGNSVASHLVREAGLPAVVPGSQLPVVLLGQAPWELEV